MGKILTKKQIIFLSIYLVLIMTLYADNALSNGGPIDWSNIHKLNQIKLLTKGDVLLKKEDLSIVIVGDYSVITAKYVLQNTNNQKGIDVKYGYPIDFTGTDMDGPEPTWDTATVKIFHIAVNGVILKTSSYEDDKTFTDSVQSEQESTPIQYKRKWYLCNFNIGKSSAINLDVSFKLKNTFVDASFSKSFFTEFSPRHIRYDLSPARYWGNSTIGELQIYVDARNIAANDGSIVVKGMMFTEKEKGLFIYQKNNYQITPKSVINISYDDTIAKRTEEIEKQRIPFKRMKIVASSSLSEEGSASNLANTDFTRSWILAKSGIGEWVEFKLKKCKVGAICMVGGYFKNAQAFSEYTYPRKVKIIVQRHWEEGDTTINTTEDIVDIPRQSYTMLRIDNYSKRIAVLQDYGDGQPVVTKVRIEILDVWKGFKYKGTAIAKILFLGSVVK